MPATGSRFRSLLLSSVVVSAIAGAPTARADDVIYRDRLWGPQGLWVALEGSYLFASGAKQPWAATPSNATGSEQNLLQLDSGHALSGKIELGYRFARGFDIALSFRGLGESKKTDAVAGTPIEVGPGIFYPIVFDVLGPLKTFYSAATVESRSHLMVVDFEVGYDVGLGDRARARLHGGIRYARLANETKFAGSFYGNPRFATLDINNTTWGVGPRVGVDAKVKLANAGNGYVFLVGGVAGAVLFGRTQIDGTRTVASSTFFPGVSGFGSEKSNTSFNVELKLGLSYAFPLASWAAAITVGYNADLWWNIVNTRGANGSTGGLGVSNQYQAGAGTTDGNRFYHGPYISFRINF